MCFGFGHYNIPRCGTSKKDPVDIAAKEGTNWQEILASLVSKGDFLSGSFGQKAEKREEWGKGWVVKEIFGED